MYDNRSAIQESAAFIEMHFAKESIYRSEQVHENGVPHAWIVESHNWMNARIGYEQSFGIGTVAEQREWFGFLLETARDQRLGGNHSLSKFMLIAWASKSKNLYAFAYLQGHQDGRKDGIVFKKRYEDLGTKAAHKSLSKAGKQGAKSKNAPFEAIKRWGIHNAAGLKAHDKKIALDLSRQLPEHLVGISKDPSRLIYDALRAEKSKS